MDSAQFLYERFFPALFLSVSVETVLLLVLARRVFRLKAAEVPTGRIVFAGVLATSATLPYVWFVFWELLGGTVLYAPVAETFVLAAEAFILKALLGLSLRRAFAASFACNAASFSLGLLLCGP